MTLLYVSDLLSSLITFIYPMFGSFFIIFFTLLFFRKIANL